MKDGVLARLSLRIVPTAVWLLTRIWFATCRVRMQGEEHLRATLKSRQTIVSFWHYAVLGVFQVMRNYTGVAMVSSSSDGEYVARFARLCGYEAVRGSRNKQGIQALKELLRHCRAGQNAALVADGSQGPPRIAQPGAILLASRTGVPILPMVWSASRYLSIRSWDRTSFPKPFSRVEVIFGEPIEVPADIKAEGIEEYRLLLENRLNEMYERAWSLQGRKEH